MNTKDRFILIIGGAGYIGSVLVRRLLSGGYKVRVLDRLLYNNYSSIEDLIPNANFTFIRGDFCESPVLKESLRGITDVVLLAALVGDPLCKKYPDEALRVNQNGSISLINSLQNKFDGRFLFLSTCSNYGLRESDEPADEESPLNPQSLYAETKVHVERYIMDICKQVDFCATILRSATAFGLSPRMRFDLTVSEFTRELALGRELLVYDEHTWRPYCHVADISGAIVKILESKRDSVHGEVFNVGSNRNNHTKLDIVQLLENYLDDCRVRYKTGGRDPRNYKVSFDKIVTRLNFIASHSVEDSIRELIEKIQYGEFVDLEKNKRFYGNYELPD